MTESTKDNWVFAALITLSTSLAFWSASTLYPQVGIFDLIHVVFMAAVMGYVIGMFTAKKLNDAIDTKVQLSVIHQESERVLTALRAEIHKERAERGLSPTDRLQ